MPPARKIERRTLHRVIKRIPVSFDAGTVRGEGHIKNISKRGMFVRAEVLPPVGSVVRARFHDRAGAKVEVRGKVLWTTAQLSASGVARPGFGVAIARDDQAFAEFFEQILFT